MTVIVYQGNVTMIAKPGVTIGISDEANRALHDFQVKEALEKNDMAAYQLLTQNEKDGGVKIPEINVQDLDEDEEFE